MKKETAIAIIGSGNVASHLAKAFRGKLTVYEINPHTLDGLPRDADFVLIAVKDSAIRDVAQSLRGIQGIVAHTSGSIPMSVLSDVSPRYGVFYPLQTFTKNVPLEYSEIPFFIEGDSPETEQSLISLAHLISDNIHLAGSAERNKLHLASVFACNFTNALAGIADEILSSANLDYSVILPLMRQTVDKLSRLKPDEAQTGPAVRGDHSVTDSHMQMLEKEYGNEPAEIYRLLTERIVSRKSGKK